tara:strand:+ start:28 stop:1179 length:1152 start_codon:yes stop_codon:yes gene_type:complete
MAITDKKTGVWGLDQTYNKINQGSIWDYSGAPGLFSWGSGTYGQIGQNSLTQYSSPVQIPGTSWRHITSSSYVTAALATKTDGTLWGWGHNLFGALAQNDRIYYSSPVQVGGDTTWSDTLAINYRHSSAIKTDSTLWIWGFNSKGQLGQNNKTDYSSPVQIPGTWSDVSSDLYGNLAIKTNGELWVWGYNTNGQLGINDRTEYSSPKQVPGTTWRSIHGGVYHTHATRTDGTLWSWGWNGGGRLGLNSPGPSQRSSPTQVGSDTTWSTKIVFSGSGGTRAVKTDGTMWGWGNNTNGQLGVNDTAPRSSPIQVGSGTDWSDVASGQYATAGLKTDGTLWVWGYNGQGTLGQNQSLNRISSPVQIPGTWTSIGSRQFGFQGFSSI